MSAAVEVHDVNAGYGDHQVLFGATLSAERGTMTCILGPSGCGKTTLLRTIAGFERARSGSISINGRMLDDGRSRVPPERRRIGYVPQEGALFPHLTVADNIGFAMQRTTRIARATRSTKVAELLDLVGMSELAARMPHELSGGQQQRVSVARALASEPDVVLLDEPFAALDQSLRDRLRHDIREILHHAAVTAVLVTHDRAEALSLADQVAVMFDGHIVQVDSPRTVYRRPVDEHVAGFVGDVNVIEAARTSPRDTSTAASPGEASTALGVVSLDIELGDRKHVLVRPEQLDVVRRRDASGSAHGTLRSVEYYGHDARLEIEVDVPTGSIMLLARTPGHEEFVEGDHVDITVRGTVWPME